jgi:hypothetical protein
VTSGRVAAVAREASGGTHKDTSGAIKRLGEGMQDVVSGGVEMLGAGVEVIGEGVAKLGEVTRRVPLVGASVEKLGEGIAKAGESIGALPRVAQTRRGRLLVRSVIVGFVLVFAWIAAIVAWQLRENDTPDFRPLAEHILVEISTGSAAIGKVYEQASPRFQEMVREERFIDEYTDMNATLGAFREITSINDTLVTNGPTGEVGRVSFTAAYDKGSCRGSISFHWFHGRWRLLGIALELPPDMRITQAQREQRVAACKDPDDRRTCAVRDLAEHILEQVRDGQAGAVWDGASKLFQQQVSRTRFIELQAEHAAALGAYKRIISVTEAKVIGGTSATFDVLAEFERSSAVRTVFGFTRTDEKAPWQLESLKVVVPMPRADEAPPEPPPGPPGADPAP